MKLSRAKILVSIFILIFFLTLFIISLTMTVAAIYKPYEKPTLHHPLGTDNAGRDLLAYLLRGAGTALQFGILTPALSIFIAIFALFSIFNIKTERIMNDITNFFIAIPKYPLFIVLSFALPPNNWIALIVLSLLLWSNPFRILRPTFKQLLESGYVKSATILGGGSLYIMRRYLLRKTAQLLISHYAWLAIRAIGIQAGLAFLGIGDITTPSWGYMIRNAFDNPFVIYDGEWLYWVIPPTICLISLAIAFLLIAISFEERRYRTTYVSRMLRIFW
ncbi:ABC transporter permease [Saccharolobus islandicus]|uniref:ABC transporter permease n=1 Tax=Saccharolobus islandicus TaxID=43080 RepID=UPI00037B4D53|nr:ABC transporter permease subunit [Sulfolobus islandicus]